MRFCIANVSETFSVEPERTVLVVAVCRDLLQPTCQQTLWFLQARVDLSFASQRWPMERFKAQRRYQVALESTDTCHIMQQYHISIIQVSTIHVFYKLPYETIKSSYFKIFICTHINNSFFTEPSDHLNHWMLAMIGIGCVFIAFVGVSIYLMWWVVKH